ncbi:MAG: HPr family phosphocarrier protein [Ruminococcaceae bacterium]|nr:HPr family phosphocarrier protein [Oscillospiraceae bacterium]MBD5117020.1 HPr family phosphocarrier protein [Oscillospiraceae bacterium]
MANLKIKLATIDDVKNFVSITTTFNCEVDVVSNRYVVDAKSIMGLFSLDLTKPLTLKINSSDEAVKKQIMERLNQFAAD